MTGPTTRVFAAETQQACVPSGGNHGDLLLAGPHAGGEAVGLRCENLDLGTATLIVCEQIIQLGWATERTQPKAGSERVVALDRWTVEVSSSTRPSRPQSFVHLA
jgi:hypothetical protein